MQKQFTDIFGNTIFNDDVLAMKKNIGDEEFDLILSDPPYNINYSNNRRVKTRDSIYGVNGILNDKDNLDMIEETYKEYFRILKEGKHIYIFSRWDVVDTHINLLKKAGFVIKNNLIWMKNSWSMGDLMGDYAGQYENIIFGYKPFTKGTKKGKGEKLNKIGNTIRHSNILQFDRVVGKKQFHSHQKPIDLLQFLIKKSTNVGDKVYDGFLGSNSLGLAAISTFRKYSGTELFEEVYEKTIVNLESICKKIDNFINNKEENFIYIEEIYTFFIDKDKIDNVFGDKNELFIKSGKNTITINKDILLIEKDYIEYNGFIVLNIR